MEQMFRRIWSECLGVEVERPWPRMTYVEADRRFGTDKPDTRFGLELIDASAFTFLWVTGFPMFEWDEDEQRWSAVHHPFTRPAVEWKDRFADDPAHALAHAYDLIVNGNELGGGSFRIHEPEIQAKVFDLLQLSPDEQRVKFGFLLDALAMGAPPHGGIALGIDRMTMVLAGEPNLRDVIAFPKNQAGVDPMSGAPSEVTPQQLAELGIRIVLPEPGRG